MIICRTTESSGAKVSWPGELGWEAFSQPIALVGEGEENLAKKTKGKVWLLSVPTGESPSGSLNHPAGVVQGSKEL